MLTFAVKDEFEIVKGPVLSVTTKHPLLEPIPRCFVSENRFKRVWRKVLFTM